MGEKIDVLEHAGEILTAVDKGVLLTSAANGKVNTMTISWGMLGVEWARPVFVTFVREGRFTRTLLDETGEFTIGIPGEGFDRKVLGRAGSVTGRDVDKISELGLHTVKSQVVSVPAIAEAAVTLECRVVYRQPQDRNALPADFIDRFYPQDVPSTNCLGNRDVHIAYYGEVVAAYTM
ncbi:MAG: flavin reductase family protein [Olsenella sp.]|jgi:flavin reductase (DIM6/NTAB) family NADH-FMN oxidoreductase RutF|nr:flavin reductase family protein [Olsenella sp.]MCH3956072.1 flavin reductase family protein [Olsenella sp.]MCI1646426.1 flavin reductase family protein [Olsenella sp.]MCI1794188.1 flavin reductase family protein [Olsenella sp.]MCI1812315.1 flavin reductase family protein [Olsenella sp.]